ncbi:hypothetical protein ABE522_00610 [Stenotrophomonas pennii]|uniref:hypothetical protein n=1 Tax=Stenotrophomonas lacuserhaii TaxID=2760084 RepID=UPI003207A175
MLIENNPAQAGFFLRRIRHADVALLPRPRRARVVIAIKTGAEVQEMRDHKCITSDMPRVIDVTDWHQSEFSDLHVGCIPTNK